MNHKNSLKVVYTYNNKPYRKILKKGEYEILKDGKIKLPKNHFSAGYYERLTDSDWIDLPILENVSDTENNTNTKNNSKNHKTDNKK